MNRQIMRSTKSGLYSYLLTDWKGKFLAIWIFLALGGDFIANERPIIAKVDGQIYLPVLSGYAEYFGYSSGYQLPLGTSWQDQAWDFVLFPLIPYSGATIDIDNLNFTGPFEKQRIQSNRYRHWLGTDSVGRDVAAGIIEGVRTSLLAGVFAMSIAALIGIFLGSLAGYYGDSGLQLHPVQFLTLLFGMIAGSWIAWGGRIYVLIHSTTPLREWIVSLLIFLSIPALLYLLVNLFFKNKTAGYKLNIPVDLMVMRLVELFHAIPLLLLIIALLAVIKKPSFWHVVIIIGLVSWTGIARFARAEFLRIRHLEFVEASKVLGFSDLRIIAKHILPNAIRPLLIVFSFGVAGAILAESVLSFLGIGNPGEVITWGGMLRQARSNISAWWMALFPGLALFSTLVVFNLWGETLGKIKP